MLGEAGVYMHVSVGNVVGLFVILLWIELRDGTLCFYID